MPRVSTRSNLPAEIPGRRSVIAATTCPNPGQSGYSSTYSPYAVSSATHVYTSVAPSSLCPLTQWISSQAMPNGEPRVRSHQTPRSSANSLGLAVPAGHAHHCLTPNLSEPASYGLVPQIIRTRVGPTPRAPWTVADCEIDLRPGVSSELLSGSHPRDLHAVDRRQRVEEAAPCLAAI